MRYTQFEERTFVGIGAGAPGGETTWERAGCAGATAASARAEIRRFYGEDPGLDA
jgi:hypothetical protein